MKVIPNKTIGIEFKRKEINVILSALEPDLSSYDSGNHEDYKYRKELFENLHSLLDNFDFLE